MSKAKEYLLELGLDDAHLPEIFNDSDKSYYTIPELLTAFANEQTQPLKDEIKENRMYQLGEYKGSEIYKHLIDNYSLPELVNAELTETNKQNKELKKSISERLQYESMRDDVIIKTNKQLKDYKQREDYWYNNFNDRYPDEVSELLSKLNKD